jgi:AcrR family transcriptional regulator
MSDRDPKEVILDAALAALAEHGFEGTTTSHILARAKVSNGALFHHFPNKDAIAETLYLRGIASYQEGLIKALEDHRGAKATRATVKAAVHHHLAWVEANRDLARFMYERGRPDWQPAHGPEVRKLNRATAAHVRDWMAPLVQAGVIRDLPPIALAALVNGPAHFVARRWLSGLTTARPTTFSDVLADAVWVAIAPHKTRSSPIPPPRASTAGLIETAALEAIYPISPNGQWSVVHLTMSDVSHTPQPHGQSATVRSIRREGDGRIAMIEVDLVAANGNVSARGDVVCLWRQADGMSLATENEFQSIGERA